MTAGTPCAAHPMRQLLKWLSTRLFKSFLVQVSVEQDGSAARHAALATACGDAHSQGGKGRTGRSLLHWSLLRPKPRGHTPEHQGCCTHSPGTAPTCPLSSGRQKCSTLHISHQRFPPGLFATQQIPRAQPIGQHTHRSCMGNPTFGMSQPSEGAAGLSPGVGRVQRKLGPTSLGVSTLPSALSPGALRASCKWGQGWKPLKHA